MIVTAIVLGVIALSAELAILAGMVCDGERWNTWPLNVLLWTLIALSIPSLLVVATIVLLVNFFVDWRKA